MSLIATIVEPAPTHEPAGPCPNRPALTPLAARERLDQIAVIVPSLNAAHWLPTTLGALRPTAELVVVDGGSTDGSVALAARSGAKVFRAPAGRGSQLDLGAQRTTSPWLLFLHADTSLDAQAWSALEAWVAAPESRGRAAVFRLLLDDDAWQARVLEFGVGLRGAALALPYGDQGLLIHRTLYERVGGFASLPLMEDVDLIRRLGRRRLRLLPGAAVTSAERWRRRGWLRQSLLNMRCLVLFLLGTPAERIARVYDR